jgi:hypothetical protein
VWRDALHQNQGLSGEARGVHGLLGQSLLWLRLKQAHIQLLDGQETAPRKGDGVSPFGTGGYAFQLRRFEETESSVELERYKNEKRAQEK